MIKKNVVIDLRTGGDWSLDLCFAGLCLNLEYGNVFDIPFKDKHREWFDVIDGNKKSDWGLERRTLGFNSSIIDDRKSNVIGSTDETTLKILLERDEIERVWLDERMESFAKYKQSGLDKSSTKVVVVAGHDRFWNHSPKFVADLYGNKLEAMLLDNWYPEYSKLPFKTKRIGWSCNFDHYWNRPETAPEKDIDISFIGYNSHPDRLRFIEHINKTWSHLKLHLVLETEPNSFNNFIPKSEYFNIIQRSKICLNLRGAADRGKTMRFYEIPYVGSFMLSQAIEDSGVYEDFQNGVHCSYFNDENDLDFMIKQNLILDHSRELIAEAGHQKAINSLSVKQRWNDVLQWLNNGK